MTLCLQPDVRRAVTARVSDLMGQNWTIRFFAEVHQEVLVDREAAVNRVHVDLHHHRTFPKDAQADSQIDRYSDKQADRDS